MIYVDHIAKGGWSHMATDGEIDELHSFAKKIGLKRKWLHVTQLKGGYTIPHYDLRPSKFWLAVNNGAVVISSQELVEKCKRKPEEGN